VTPLTGGTGVATDYSTSGDRTKAYLASDGSSLYWGDAQSEKVWGCALGAACGSATSLATFTNKQPSGIAVTGANVVFATVPSFGGKALIQSVPVGDGTVTTICSLPGFVSAINGLVVNGTDVYFTASGAVHTCSLSTSGVTAGVYIKDKNAPFGLATDGTDLYWTDNKASGAIMKCALGSSCASATTVTNAKNPKGIALSATDVYFTSTAGDVLYFHK